MFASVQIADSIQQGLDSLLGFIPNIIGFLVILVIGYFIAKLVKGIVARLLEKVGLDRTLHSSDAGKYVEKVSPGASPARLIGSVAFWFIFLFAISARHRRAEDPGAEHVHRAGPGVPAQHHRRAADLRDRRRARRRRRRPPPTSSWATRPPARWSARSRRR